jgi:hypothetical protein
MLAQRWRDQCQPRVIKMGEKTKGFALGVKSDSNETRVDAKFQLSKIASSKFDRRFVVSPLKPRARQGAGDSSSERQRKPDANAPEFDAGKDCAEQAPHSAAGDDGLPSAKDVLDVGGGAERAGDLSPGKNRDLASSVVHYIGQIGETWRRVVQAMMEVARLCAEADAHLTTAQKSELIKALPFGAATFSKLLRIGTDIRLHTPDIQRLLPAHYTTVYAVTLLTDEELKRAIAEKVIYPDMKRADLQRWRKSRNLGHLPPAGGSAGSPIAPTHAVGSGSLPFTTSGDDNRENRDEVAAAPNDAPALEAVTTAAVTASPSTMPPGDGGIPAFLDRRPLSADDQRAFDAIMAALNSASQVVRERVRAELVRANCAAVKASSRRQDDDAGPIANRPAESAALVYTADSTEPAEMAKPEPVGEASPAVIPHALAHVDAGIKYRNVQTPGLTTISKNFEVVRRKRRRPAKALGSLENSPF